MHRRDTVVVVVVVVAVARRLQQAVVGIATAVVAWRRGRRQRMCSVTLARSLWTVAY